MPATPTHTTRQPIVLPLLDMLRTRSKGQEQINLPPSKARGHKTPLLGFNFPEDHFLPKSRSSAKQPLGRGDGARRVRQGVQEPREPYYPPYEQEPAYGADSYDRGDPDDPYYSQPAGRRRQKDLVATYTSSISRKLIVALLAAFTTGILSHFLFMMIISTSHSLLLFLLSLASFVSTFTPTALGDFSRALGVAVWVATGRLPVGLVMLRFVRQLKALLSTRRPFPPPAQENTTPLAYSPIASTLTLFLT
eukprot:gene34231-41439_t